MKIKMLGAFAAIFLLAACTTGTKVSTPLAVTPAPGSQEELVSKIGDRVFFSFDKSTLSDTAQSILNHQASWLTQYPRNNILVSGNCDDRGTEEYNIALGMRRATTVRTYLGSKGIPGNRITTISYGKERPIVVGDDPVSLAQNRNAITTLH